MAFKHSLGFKLGTGFFADAYDIFVIDIVLGILKDLAKTDSAGMGDLNTYSGWVTSATSLGSVVGMVLFGIVGDHLGRVSAAVSTGAIVVLGSLLSGLAFRSEGFPLVWQLIILRFLLGVGIGGEYPLSAVLASEKARHLDDEAARASAAVADQKEADSEVTDPADAATAAAAPTPVPNAKNLWAVSTSVRLCTLVFGMQGFGKALSTILGWTMLKSGVPGEVVWRTLLIFGCLPSVAAVWFRLRMDESGSFSTHKANLSKTHRSVREKLSYMYGIVKTYKRELLGTCSTWFLLDVTFYGTGQFSTAISDGFYSNPDIVQKVQFSMFVALMAIPGYICAYLFIGRIGLYNLQIYGFIAMILCYVIVAVIVHVNVGSPEVKMLFYGLTFFFTNFGPNTTTFVIPSELFPTAVKATCHGLSAAMGKLGAVLGAQAFPYAKKFIQVYGVLYCCVGVALLGLLCSVLYTPRNVGWVSLTGKKSPQQV